MACGKPSDEALVTISAASKLVERKFPKSIVDAFEKDATADALQIPLSCNQDVLQFWRGKWLSFMSEMVSGGWRSAGVRA
jgi:hypothetical protein